MIEVAIPNRGPDSKADSTDSQTVFKFETDQRNGTAHPGWLVQQDEQHKLFLSDVPEQVRETVKERGYTLEER